MSALDVIQSVGALAGIVALGIQAFQTWRRRHFPRDIDGLRQTLDHVYRVLLPVWSGPTGTPSLDMVADEEGNRLAIDLPRYAGRIADKELAELVREVGVHYIRAFAIGTNLNRQERDAKLVSEQLIAARLGMDALHKAVTRLDSIERQLRP